MSGFVSTLLLKLRKVKFSQVFDNTCWIVLLPRSSGYFSLWIGKQIFHLSFPSAVMRKRKQALGHKSNNYDYSPQIQNSTNQNNGIAVWSTKSVLSMYWESFMTKSPGFFCHLHLWLLWIILFSTLYNFGKLL